MPTALTFMSSASDPNHSVVRDLATRLSTAQMCENGACLCHVELALRRIKSPDAARLRPR
jgi:hypothetical protein